MVAGVRGVLRVVGVVGQLLGARHGVLVRGAWWHGRRWRRWLHAAVVHHFRHEIVATTREALHCFFGGTEFALSCTHRRGKLLL